MLTVVTNGAANGFARDMNPVSCPSDVAPPCVLVMTLWPVYVESAVVEPGTGTSVSMTKSAASPISTPARRTEEQRSRSGGRRRDSANVPRDHDLDYELISACVGLWLLTVFVCGNAAAPVAVALHAQDQKH